MSRTLLIMAGIWFLLATGLLLRAIWKHCKVMPRRCKDCKWCSSRQPKTLIAYCWFYRGAVYMFDISSCKGRGNYARKFWKIWRPK